MEMNPKILLAAAFVLLLGTAGAKYDLCDSVERDSNAGLFRCNITSTIYDFKQQDIDGFWAKLKEDGDYINDRLSVVEWKIKGTVLQVGDDLRFIQPKGVNLAWDIVLEGDVNTTHDINQSIATGPRPTNHTAIKKKIGAMQEYLISFAPLEERRSVRNITLEKPEGAFAVYISGSHIKKMVIEIEGDLSLTASYLENLELVKAKNIYLYDDAYIRQAGRVEAENLLLENKSQIKGIGKFGEKAIVLRNSSFGLVAKDNCLIFDAVGGIEVDGDIALENSRIENTSYAPSDVIQWVHADSLTLSDGSWIRGLGGSPGEITISGALSLDESSIKGKEAYKPKSITAKSIKLTGNSYIDGFLESIRVTGRETFRLESGSTIRNFSGAINSCAPLSLDGNTTKILFAGTAAPEIRAKGIDLNDSAEIACTGQADCNYVFTEQDCSVVPSATLSVKGASSGTVPFTVEFFGECDGKGTPVTCTIDFGDGSSPEPFDVNKAHVYAEVGNFTAELAAKNADNKEAKSSQKIVVVEEGTDIPASGPVQVSLPKQSFQKGDEVSLTVDCNIEFGSFRVENDLGLPPVTSIPESCPATIGPFRIPENALAGTHTFVVSGTTEGGDAFSQAVSFSVQESLVTFDLNGLMGYGPAILATVAVAVAVLVVLVAKKKGLKIGLPKLKKKVGAQPVQEKPAWGGAVPSEKKPVSAGEKSYLPSEKLTAFKPAKEQSSFAEFAERIDKSREAEEKPEAEGEEAMPKEQAKEKKIGLFGRLAKRIPGQKGLPEKPAKKEAGFAGALEKPAGKEPEAGVPEKQAKEEARPEAEEKPFRPEAGALKPEPAEEEPAERFQRLVDMLKRSREGEALEGREAEESEEKRAEAPEPRKPMPSAEMDWPELGKAPEKVAVPKKRPLFEEEPLPEEKPAEAMPEEEPQPAAQKEPALEEEKKGFSFFKRKKKPEPEEETSQGSGEELPPWLQKSDEEEE